MNTLEKINNFHNIKMETLLTANGIVNKLWNLGIKNTDAFALPNGNIAVTGHLPENEGYLEFDFKIFNDIEFEVEKEDKVIIEKHIQYYDVNQSIKTALNIIKGVSNE